MTSKSCVQLQTFCWLFLGCLFLFVLFSISKFSRHCLLIHFPSIINASSVTCESQLLSVHTWKNPVSITYDVEVISRGFARPAHSPHIFNSIHLYLMCISSPVFVGLNSHYRNRIWLKNLYDFTDIIRYLLNSTGEANRCFEKDQSRVQDAQVSVKASEADERSFFSYQRGPG